MLDDRGQRLDRRLGRRHGHDGEPLRCLHVETLQDGRDDGRVALHAYEKATPGGRLGVDEERPLGHCIAHRRLADRLERPALIAGPPQQRFEGAVLHLAEPHPPAQSASSLRMFAAGAAKAIEGARVPTQLGQQGVDMGTLEAPALGVSPGGGGLLPPAADDRLLVVERPDDAEEVHVGVTPTMRAGTDGRCNSRATNRRW